MSTRKRGRSSISFASIAAYWEENWEKTFPDLPVGALCGWSEPFCFHCGWLAPMPEEVRGNNPWRVIGGWLEKAHLQDFYSGGADEPSNIVPLCVLCHRDMPDFPDSPEPAIAWVKGRWHRSCPRQWQTYTDMRWGGDSFDKCPGSVELNKQCRLLMTQEDMARQAVAAAKYGHDAEALGYMQAAGVSADDARRILAGYQADRTEGLLFA